MTALRLESRKGNHDSKLVQIPQEQIQELKEFLTKVSSLPYKKPVSKPNPRWRMFYARRWEDAADVASLTAHHAAMETKLSNEWAAAHLSHDDAGGVNMGKPSSHNSALMAGWHATIKAARAAGREKEAKAAQDSRFGSGNQDEFSIGLMAGLILVKDLKFGGKERYVKHARDRMEVLEKGYGIAADVNGTLYVYAQAGQQLREHLREDSTT